MIKRIGKQAYQLLLASLLIGVLFAAFQGSATFAQIVPEEPVLVGGGGGGVGGGGGKICPRLVGCGDFGCHPKSIIDPTMICSRYKLSEGPFSCPSPVNCI
jgi:hypothetical protein